MQWLNRTIGNIMMAIAWFAVLLWLSYGKTEECLEIYQFRELNGHQEIFISQFWWPLILQCLKSAKKRIQVENSVRLWVSSWWSSQDMLQLSCIRKWMSIVEESHRCMRECHKDVEKTGKNWYSISLQLVIWYIFIRHMLDLWDLINF